MGEISQSIEVGNYGNWVRIKAIIDTGAETSFISLKLAKKISAPKYKKISTVLADGSVVGGYFSQINAKIQNRIGLVDVIVVENLDGELLLGQDWMQKNEVIIDMSTDKFKYGKRQPMLKRIYKLR